MKYHRIYIVGSGAVGKALAVSLKLENKEVRIILGRVNDGSSHKEEIQVVLNNEKELEACIEITTLGNLSRLNGVVILANKSYGNEELARRLKKKINNSPIILLQNGLEIEQPFIDRNFPEIYRCVLFMTSQNITEKRVRYKPVSISPIGIIKGSKTNLQAIVEHIDSPNFPFKTELDIQSIVWRKAIINSVFNSVCPLLETDNGVFYREKDVYDIAKRVVKECVTISNDNGIPQDESKILEDILSISKASDGQFISTLQDIRNSRQTEIDTFNLIFD